MPPRKTKSKTKSKTTRPRKGRRSRYPRNNRKNVPEWASLSATRTILPAAGGNFATNNMYEVHNVRLIDYTRPSSVALAYQFYRIKNVKFTYKLPYDTFQNAAGSPARPNFYWMIDKGESLPANPTLEALRQMGARPRACDNKPISISYAPAVLMADDATGGVLPAQYRVSPWLSTDTDDVLHNGHFWYIEEAFRQPQVGTQYFVEIEVQFEFKQPKWLASASAAPAIGTVMATLDASPDGIEGGTDGITIPIVR